MNLNFFRVSFYICNSHTKTIILTQYSDCIYDGIYFNCVDFVKNIVPVPTQEIFRNKI